MTVNDEGSKPLPNDEHEFWSLLRQAFLLIVDAIERCKLRLPAEQRTAEMRRARRTA